MLTDGGREGGEIVFDAGNAPHVTDQPFPTAGATKVCPRCFQESEIIHDEPRPRGGRLRTYRCKVCKLQHYEVYDVDPDKTDKGR